MAARILVADDHEIVLEGIRTLVQRSGRGWEICGEARNGRDAVDLANSLHPDVIILDITMPIMSGLEAASQLSRAGNGRILIFTMHESPRLEAEVRAAGAQGFVLKSEAARDLIRAIDHLLAGDIFYGNPPQEKEDKASTDKKTSNNVFFWSAAFDLG
jgi:DNA-binding NarL/FixJ family response regulator